MDQSTRNQLGINQLCGDSPGTVPARPLRGPHGWINQPRGDQFPPGVFPSAVLLASQASGIHVLGSDLAQFNETGLPPQGRYMVV